MIDEFGSGFDGMDSLETAPEPDLTVFEPLSEEELTAGLDSFNPDDYSPEMVDMALDNITQNPIEDMEMAPDADLSVFESLSEEELAAGLDSFDPGEYSSEMVNAALDYMEQNPVEDMDAPMTLTRDQTEQWISGNNAIDDTVEAMRDNLRDLGMEDGQEMENIVMTERARMQEELSRNIEGDFSQSYEMPNFQELYGELNDGELVESEIPEGGTEIYPDPDEEYIIEGPEGAEIYPDGPIVDENGMETAPDADLSVFENLSEDELTAGPESNPDEFSPETVENAFDYMENDPIEDEEPFFPGETLVESEIPEGGTEIYPDPDEEYIIEGPEGAEIYPDEPILEPEAMEGGDTYIEYPAETEIYPDSLQETEQPETAEKPFDYSEIKDQLDKEFIEDAFKDIDCFSETEKLDSLMEPFENDNWEKLDTQEKLDSMEKLKDYLSNKLDLKNPPSFVPYTADPGEFGGYSNSTNELLVNELALESNTEAVDTVAHELWHARQHQLAAEATEPRHFQYQYQFENYIRPEDDFDGYESQLIEQEARAFGSKFQEYLRNKKGA